MIILRPKLQVIGEILKSRDFKKIDSLQELTQLECVELLEQSNIKFADTAEGVMCFRAHKPGQSGHAATRIKSLIYFLDAYGKVKIDPTTQEVHLEWELSPNEV